MDPNATLAELREMAQVEFETDGVWTSETGTDRCLRYAELILALDDWLGHNGALPDNWKR